MGRPMTPAYPAFEPREMKLHVGGTVDGMLRSVVVIEVPTTDRHLPRVPLVQPIGIMPWACSNEAFTHVMRLLVTEWEDHAGRSWWSHAH